MALTHVADIRPETEGTKLWAEALQSDLNWLMARRAEFVSVPCSACGESAREDEFEKNGYSFLRCAQCHTLYMAEHPSAALLGEYYAHSAMVSYFSRHVFPASSEARLERIYKPRRNSC